MATQKKYALHLNDPKALNRMFYNQFDPEFIYTKADALWFIDQHRGQFLSFITGAGGTTEDLNAEYFGTLQAEIHFSFFHQCETFFALVFAAFQQIPHWLYLTTYETREVKANIQQYVDNDYSQIGGKAITDSRSFLHWGIYTGATIHELPPGKTWGDALDNLDHFLRIVARRYLAGTEYNAYKHGIRILRGKQSFKIHPPGQPDKPNTSLESDNALTFLELKDKKEGAFTVHQTTMFFNVKEDFGHLELLAQLATSIKNTRLEHFGGKAKKREITAFFDLDRKQLAEMAEITTWSFTL